MRQQPIPVVIDEVLDRATEVIGEREEAYRWMGTPVRALGYETPIAMLATAEGVKAVQAVLGRSLLTPAYRLHFDSRLK